MLYELGLPVPSLEDGVRRLAQEVSRDIVVGSVDTSLGAEMLRGLARNLDRDRDARVGKLLEVFLHLDDDDGVFPNSPEARERRIVDEAWEVLGA